MWSKPVQWNCVYFLREYVILKLLFFYKFYDLFCWRHSLMSRPCYSNLFQFMQHGNFWNLNRVIFTNWKHLKSWVNAFWYCFPAIKQYIFPCLMKSAPILGNQSSFEIFSSLSNSNYFTSAKKCRRESCIIDFTSAKMEIASAISKKLYFPKYSIKRCCK